MPNCCNNCCNNCRNQCIPNRQRIRHRQLALIRKYNNSTKSRPMNSQKTPSQCTDCFCGKNWEDACCLRSTALPCTYPNVGCPTGLSCFANCPKSCPPTPKPTPTMYKCTTATGACTLNAKGTMTFAQCDNTCQPPSTPTPTPKPKYAGILAWVVADDEDSIFQKNVKYIVNRLPSEHFSDFLNGVMVTSTSNNQDSSFFPPPTSNSSGINSLNTLAAGTFTEDVNATIKNYNQGADEWQPQTFFGCPQVLGAPHCPSAPKPQIKQFRSRYSTPCCFSNEIWLIVGGDGVLECPIDITILYQNLKTMNATGIVFDGEGCVSPTDIPTTFKSLMRSYPNDADYIRNLKFIAMLTGGEKFMPKKYYSYSLASKAWIGVGGTLQNYYIAPMLYWGRGSTNCNGGVSWCGNKAYGCSSIRYNLEYISNPEDQGGLGWPTNQTLLTYEGGLDLTDTCNTDPNSPSGSVSLLDNLVTTLTSGSVNNGTTCSVEVTCPIG